MTSSTGRTLGRYRLERLVGRGGMAEVWEARDPTLGRRVDPRLGPARVVLARFAGDQYLWAGDAATAISWYKKLLAAPDRTEIGAVLRVLGEEGGTTLLARACNDGFRPECDVGRPQLPAARARRARQQP